MSILIIEFIGAILVGLQVNYFNIIGFPYL